MRSRPARGVERELSAQSHLKVVADVGKPGSREDRREGLSRRPRYELVVVELVEQEHVAQRPLQSDILNIVAEIRERVLDRRVGKHMMTGRSSQRRHMAK